LSGFQEPLQIAEYESGGHYDWHVDIGADITSGRKISASVQLSDGNGYEGGELEFLNVDSMDFPRSLGSVIIFPSYLPHRVKPVTRGIRRSLVVWVHGNPFS
jgi:PKHD-type hydroxylase